MKLSWSDGKSNSQFHHRLEGKKGRIQLLKGFLMKILFFRSNKLLWRSCRRILRYHQSNKTLIKNNFLLEIYFISSCMCRWISGPFYAAGRRSLVSESISPQLYQFFISLNYFYHFY